MSAQDAYQYLVKRGLSPHAAAGIVGNLSVESGNFAPNVIAGRRRGDQGTAHYVAQWRHGRVNNFHKWAASKGLQPSDLYAQLGFVLEEMDPNSPYRDTIAASNRDKILNAPSASAATKGFMDYFERPNPQYAHFDRRNSVAMGLMGQKANPSWTQPAMDQMVAMARPNAGILPEMAGDTPVSQPRAASLEEFAPQFGPVLPQVWMPPVPQGSAVAELAVPDAAATAGDLSLASLLGGFAKSANRQIADAAPTGQTGPVPTPLPSTAAVASRLGSVVPRSGTLNTQVTPTVPAPMLAQKSDILADILGASGLPTGQRRSALV